VFGAAVCYLALTGRLQWTLLSDGAAQLASEGAGDKVVLPAGVKHHIAVSRGPVLCYLVETEFTESSPATLHGVEESLVACEGLDAGAWRERLLHFGGAELERWQAEMAPSNAGLGGLLDRLVLGRPWPARRLDPRIEGVVERVRADPALAWQAGDAAAHCGLSASRFMHLFKDEVGVGWRAYRAWKRARGLLDRVHSGESLTQLALTLGYPDATHFSHAIRQVTGLRPSDIVLGSRHLGVWSELGVTPGAAS